MEAEDSGDAGDSSEGGPDGEEGTVAVMEESTEEMRYNAGSEDSLDTVVADGISIEDFEGPESNPLRYPTGDYPEYSYVTDGEAIHKVIFGSDRKLDSAYILKDGKETPIADLLDGKVPLVAYAALKNPQELARSLGKKRFAAIKADVAGLEPLYNLISKRKGNAIAEVFPQPNASMEAHVVFLDPGDIEKLNSREEFYELIDIKATLETGSTLDSSIYMGTTSIWNKEGSPVGIREIHTANRKYEAVSQEEALAAMIEQYDLAAQGYNTPEEFVREVQSGNKQLAQLVEDAKNQDGLESALEQYKKITDVKSTMPIYKVEKTVNRVVEAVTAESYTPQPEDILPASAN